MVVTEKGKQIAGKSPAGSSTSKGKRSMLSSVAEADGGELKLEAELSFRRRRFRGLRRSSSPSDTHESHISRGTPSPNPSIPSYLTRKNRRRRSTFPREKCTGAKLPPPPIGPEIHHVVFKEFRWLSYNIDDMCLKEAFSSYGEVIEARIIMDRDSGRSRGFGFVTFTSTEEASAVLAAMDGKSLPSSPMMARKLGRLAGNRCIQFSSYEV